MASNMDGIIKKLISAMQTTSKAKTSGYDTSAVVRRIEDGTAWVHIPGGVDETPVKLTIAAKVGDVVQVRVADGRAFLVGNATAPPTDDALAVIAQYQADYANQLAALAKQSAENAETIAVQAYNTILIEYAVSPDDKYVEAIRAAENDYIRVTEDDFVRDVDLTIDGWYTEIPEIPEGYYLWTRITSTAEDGSTSVVYTVSAPGVAMEAKNTADAAQATANEAATAVTNLDRALDQEGVFNRLTNNGESQGIYIKDGKLYINAEYIKGGAINGVVFITEKSSNTIVGADTGAEYYYGFVFDSDGMSLALYDAISGERYNPTRGAIDNFIQPMLITDWLYPGDESEPIPYDVPYAKIPDFAATQIRSITYDVSVLVSHLYQSSFSRTYFITFDSATYWTYYGTIRATQPQIKRDGKIVTLTGELTPNQSFTCNETEYVIGTISEEKDRPTRNIYQLCQGPAQKIFLLSIKTTGDISISRCRNVGAASYVTVNNGEWFPIHASWIAKDIALTQR